MGATGHLSVQAGKRVQVFIRGAGSFVAKFKERRGRFVEFYDHAKVATSLIRTISIFKGKQ